MTRHKRGISFSQLFGGSKAPTPSSTPPNDSPANSSNESNINKQQTTISHKRVPSRPLTPPSSGEYDYNGQNSPLNDSPNSSPYRHKRKSSRPLSMVQTYQPRIMDINEDTIPELLPIFSYLNHHGNKLYHEGYFLKLDDQNSQGKPNPDRTWTECFSQLVGTVLSLWDAAELDAAGEDGEVLPKFLNLTDASIKMIESLPTRSSDEQPLQNILSISTAGRNRYLLHFNSHQSLVEWTSAIRLAIFEQNTLQEAYTGALIAGKGKSLNNINVILERSKFKTEEWVRVRFGAGVPWRRCWCVIEPPDEKEFAKQQKELKKRSPYDRSHVPALKGDIKFYDQKAEGKKQKKFTPIATITDAFSAYAIYPQAKSLIDASTLLKVEGNVTIHSEPPSSSEGFVFIMPEVRPMVSGFEMLLRFLFPTWDTFGLYGRPGKLVASVLDSRSLMFAMPKHKRYGYLDPQDVISLVGEPRSTTWSEQEWRKRLKESTGTRMNAIDDGSRSPPRHSRSDSNTSNRMKVGFADQGPGRGSRSQSLSHQNINNSADSVPGSYQGTPVRTPGSDQYKPPGGSPYAGLTGSPPPSELDSMRSLNTPEPVSRPPEFGPSQHKGRPTSRAYHSPELRRANSRLSSSTLANLAKAGGLDKQNQENMPQMRIMEDGAIAGPSVHTHANPMGAPANDNRSREALRPPGPDRQAQMPPPLNIPQQRSESPMGRQPYGPPSPNPSYGAGPNSPRPSTSASEGRRSPYPPGAPMGPGGPGGAPRSPRPPQHGSPGTGGPGARGGRGGPPPGYNGRGRGGPAGPGGRGYGPGGPPGNGQNFVLPSRSTSLDKHTSTTADEIIDHYADNGGRDPYRRPPPGRGPPGQNPGPRPSTGHGSDRRPQGPPQYGGGYGAPNSSSYADDGGYGGGPDAGYGQGMSYGGGRGNGGAPAPPAHGVPQYSQHQRPYSPAGPRPGTAPGSGARGMGYPEESQQRPWPGSAGAGAGPMGPPGPYGYADNRGTSSPGPMEAPGGPSSFSRPLQPGAQPSDQYDPRDMPPQGQYSNSRPSTPGQRSIHPQYQGQAF